MNVQEMIEKYIPREVFAQEMFRRAAIHFEKDGNMREAAECWAEAGNVGRAGELYQEFKEYGKAAPLLLTKGRYAEAMECYQKWLSVTTDAAIESRVSASLGIVACLKLLKRDLQRAAEMYRKTRKIIENEKNRSPLVSGHCWEALGFYGSVLGRYDLVYIGYEKSLVCYVKHNKERLRAAGLYLKSARGNRLLIEDIKKRIAEWTPEKTTEPQKPPVQLRSEPITVSSDDRITAFGLDAAWRPLEYIENNYEDLGEIVIDHTTGLMWQKWHSKQELYYNQVEEYVRNLNRDRFAGYSDWRLPTIPELTSLLEPERQTNDLYINPIFKTDRTTNWYWCWSSDLVADYVGGAWCVYFSSGLVHWSNLLNYVRVCRS